MSPVSIRSVPVVSTAAVFVGVNARHRQRKQAAPGTKRPAGREREGACHTALARRGERGGREGDLQVGGRSQALIIKMDRGQ